MANEVEFTLPPDKGFGVYNDDLTFKIMMNYIRNVTAEESWTGLSLNLR